MSLSTEVPHSSALNLIPQFQSEWHGLISYEEGLRLQSEKSQMSLGAILGLEHTPTISLGRRGSVDDVFGLKLLEQSGFVSIKSDRGGLVTLHYPGQLVVYPIVNIRNLNLGVKAWVSLLLGVTQQTLQSLEVPSVIQDSGIHLPTGEKIASLGLSISRGISFHGLALNNNNDLSFFNSLKACGRQQSFASLTSLGVLVSSEELFQQWSAVFQQRISQIQA